MRTNPTKIGRALADRLHRRHPFGATTAAEAARDGTPPDFVLATPSRTARLRRLLGASRVTPYQLRRGLLW